VTQDTTPEPFDEQAALQALEHLRGQIEAARSRRERKLAEFDAFVRSSRTASQAERLAALEALAGSPPEVRTAARAGQSGTSLPAGSSASWLAGGAPDASAPLTASSFVLARTRRVPDPWSLWRDRRMQAAAGSAAVLALVLFAFPWRSGTDGPQEPLPSTGGSTPAPVPQQAPPAAAPESQVAGAPAVVPEQPAAATSAAPRRALQIQLKTVRPVWMRVVVDGARRVEGQVGGDRTLTFEADRTIVVRAGDAGAVLLVDGGVERGALGRDGEVVTRTLTPRRK
jgi:hypothetical protein